MTDKWVALEDAACALEKSMVSFRWFQFAETDETTATIIAHVYADAPPSVLRCKFRGYDVDVKRSKKKTPKEKPA